MMYGGFGSGDLLITRCGTSKKILRNTPQPRINLNARG